MQYKKQTLALVQTTLNLSSKTSPIFIRHIYLSVCKDERERNNKITITTMSRIHPAEDRFSKEAGIRLCPSKFTVWKRSSMTFQGTDGFTVFDQHGRLAFRVDNYSRRHRCDLQGGLILMDGSGKALLTMRPQVTKKFPKRVYSLSICTVSYARKLVLLTNRRCMKRTDFKRAPPMECVRRRRRRSQLH